MLTTSPPAFVPPQQDSFQTSLWHATALESARFDALSGRQHAQVAVIGGGYTGLSAALTLAEHGRDVVVLDAREPGFGASGRNGGQVIPAFKYDPDRLAATYGEAAGEALLQMIGQAADLVFDTVARHGIACDPERGWVQVTSSPRGASLLQSRFRQWHARGAPVEQWDGPRIRMKTGATGYIAGVYFGHAGTVQPLGYARGLARAAQACGARVHANSPVGDIRRHRDGWEVHTDQGCVQCDQLIIATNGYTTDLWPQLRESVIPVYSMQIATDPLPSPLQAAVLPGVPAAADTRHLVSYYRRDRERRFIFGTRGPFRALPTAADADRLIAAARQLFPALRGVSFPHRWAGRVAMTADHVPHLHELAPGAFAALGYNGRGVALGTMMGKILASACLNGSADGLPYPAAPLKPIPLHSFHLLGVHAMIAYYRMLDGLQ
ncbi:NAD(P)/FAD-dependent oxidoreductase [Castellaniella sp.]|uniref:NAD(P)/FAD-dependent oxidoreductase n=1 Tax=Castellaniella sp. TaxID=1955812 RepID=UPI003C755C66